MLVPCLYRLACTAQVRDTYKDLYAEALRIHGGTPTLPLSLSLLPSSCAGAGTSSTSTSAAYNWDGGSACGARPAAKEEVERGLPLPSRAASDPSSVLERYSAGSSTLGSTISEDCDPSSPFAAVSSASSCGSGGSFGAPCGSRPSAAAIAESSRASPASHPLPLARLLSEAAKCPSASLASPAHSGAADGGAGAGCCCSQASTAKSEVEWLGMPVPDAW